MGVYNLNGGGDNTTMILLLIGCCCCMCSICLPVLLYFIYEPFKNWVKRTFGI